MRIFYTSHFRRTYKQYCKNNPQLKTKFERQINLFQKNILHPSLRVHKLKGKRLNQYSFWIKGDIRIIYVKDKQDIVFSAIITHGEY